MCGPAATLTEHELLQRGTWIAFSVLTKVQRGTWIVFSMLTKVGVSEVLGPAYMQLNRVK